AFDTGRAVQPRGDGRRSRPAQSEPPSAGELAGMGLTIAVALVLPALAGLGVDAVLRTSPLGVLIGLLIGIIAACAFAVNRFRRYL
ncbi:MAG TPA: AtpZ/AtpI family protein, partial [Dehalococcoidia bacterium]|nr:AtpZ/AtpI family protein [Dehalococcoidia bacterium]